MIITQVNIEGRPPPQKGYQLPFIQENVTIFQGFNGPYSHLATRRGTLGILYDDRFAIDFELPLGTPVVASKSGIVYWVDKHSDECYRGLDYEKGLATRVNFILLEHGNHFLTLYSHLAKEKIELEKGMKVEKGQILARTGLSGWVGSVPHLHFELYKNFSQEVRGGRFSCPVVFDDYDGPLEHSEINLETCLN